LALIFMLRPSAMRYITRGKQGAQAPVSMGPYNRPAGGPAHVRDVLSQISTLSRYVDLASPLALAAVLT
jgi:hypothetical protein